MILICFAFLLFFFRKRNSTQWQTTCTIITPWWYYCRTTMVSKTCHPLPWKLSRRKKHEQRQHVGTGAAPLDCIIFLAHIIIMKLKLKMWNLNSKFEGLIFLENNAKLWKFYTQKTMGFQGICWDSEKGGSPKILSNKHPPTHPNTKLIALGCFLRFFLVP